MSDRMAARIWVGGKISKANEELADELFGLLKEQWTDDWASHVTDEYIMKAVTEGKPVEVANPEIAWGEFTDLENFCKENNLCFLRHSSPRYEYDGELVLYLNGIIETAPANDDYDWRIGSHDLQDYQKKGFTIEQILEDMRKFVIFDVPLQLID